MLESIFLGILQGITEFLPVSSSAHLIFLSWLFKEKISLDYIVFLHAGTLFALFLYFRKEWVRFIVSILNFKKNKECFERKLFFLIIISTLPGAILGKLGESRVEKIFYHPLPVAINMAGFAILFFIVDRLSKKNKGINSLNFYHALFIGTTQAFAIIPGISRSGITIASGLLLGLDRESSVKFSFYLSLPIIFGAVLLKYKEIVRDLNLPYLLGFFSSFLTGLVAIYFLLRFVKAHSFNLFIIYRLLISILILGLILI